jgi:phosphatidylserine decarboxylase
VSGTGDERDAAPGRPEVDRVQRVLDRFARGARGVVAPLTGGLERAWIEAWSAPLVSAMAGRVADMRLPRRMLAGMVRAWVRAYHVDLDEAAEEIGDWETFNAFFTRRLREGARPIDAAPGSWVSPADARLADYGRIDARGQIPEVKGRRYSAAALLGDSAAASALVGGSYAVLYLSPGDYHRVHAPCGGRVADVRRIDGRRYPVNARGTRRIPGLFAVNERTVFRIESEAYGTVWLVMVGATNVSRIGVSADAGAELAAGDEVGIFNLGSTVVLLHADPSWALAGVHVGEHVRMGQRLMSRT